MESSKIWKATFTDWPKGIPQRGILLNTLNETTPFKGFMIRGEMLLLERTNPDPLGARYILIGFDEVNCIKFVDPMKEETFTAAGFVGKLSGT